MKGIIFNVLQDVVVEHHGEDAWDDLLDVAEVDGAYTAVGNYPDGELERLIAAACEARGEDAFAVTRWVGREAIPRFAQRYPRFFEAPTDARSFLRTISDIIHPEVRKLYPGASVPDFVFEGEPDGPLVMLYDSPRRLCAFAEGLILGAGDHYGEQLEPSQAACMHRGDPLCRIEIRSR